MTLRLPDCSVGIDSAVKYVLTELVQVYRAFLGESERPTQPTFVIRRHKNGLKFVGTGPDNGRVEAFVKRGEVLPRVEREINQYLVGVLPDRLLLHGAAVCRNGQVIVLPATAGSGKTTLAGGLVQRGCGYLTDELVILEDQSNRIEPFPKALSLKEGSFALFEPLGPDPTGPEYDRVWYLDPERLRPGSVIKRPMPIGWVVLPRYEGGAATRVESLTVGETVLGLFENTVNIGRHKEKGLDQLIGIAQRAPGYRLVFGDLGEACEVVLEIVGGNGPSCS